MGGATARFLARAGLTVVAVADIKGTVANPDGLDVERAAGRPGRVRHGRPARAAARRSGTARATPGWPSTRRCSSPRPSRTPSTRANQAQISARLDRRGGQHAGAAGRRGSCSPRAGSPCCPTSSSTPVPTPGGGGRCSATSAPTRTRRSPTPAARCGALIGQMLARAEADGTTPRAAAHAIVADRLPVIAERFGWYR